MPVVLSWLLLPPYEAPVLACIACVVGSISLHAGGQVLLQKGDLVPLLCESLQWVAQTLMTASRRASTSDAAMASIHSSKAEGSGEKKEEGSRAADPHSMPNQPPSTPPRRSGIPLSYDEEQDTFAFHTPSKDDNTGRPYTTDAPPVSSRRKATPSRPRTAIESKLTPGRWRKQPMKAEGTDPLLTQQQPNDLTHQCCVEVLRAITNLTCEEMEEERKAVACGCLDTVVRLAAFCCNDSGNPPLSGVRVRPPALPVLEEALSCAANLLANPEAPQGPSQPNSDHGNAGNDSSSWKSLQQLAALCQKLVIDRPHEVCVVALPC